MCFQEHNLDPSRDADLVRLAASKKVVLKVGYGNGPHHRGGVLMLIDEDTLSVENSITSART